MHYDQDDMLENLDDFYLLFINKFEDVIVILVKALILGLGCAFDLERKVSQHVVSFELESNLFKHFLQVCGKLFGLTVSLRNEGQNDYTCYSLRDQAKIPLGGADTILIWNYSPSIVKLLYNQKFFTSRGFDIASVMQAQAVVLEQQVEGQRMSIPQKEQPSLEYKLIEDNPNDKITLKEGITSYMEHNYLSNQNIYDPLSVYKTQVDQKRQSLTGQTQSKNLQHQIKGSKPNGIIQLSNYYATDDQSGIRDTNYETFGKYNTPVTPLENQVSPTHITPPHPLAGLNLCKDIHESEAHGLAITKKIETDFDDAVIPGQKDSFDTDLCDSIMFHKQNLSGSLGLFKGADESDPPNKESVKPIDLKLLYSGEPGLYSQCETTQNKAGSVNQVDQQEGSEQEEEKVSMLKLTPVEYTSSEHNSPSKPSQAILKDSGGTIPEEDEVDESLFIKEITQQSPSIACHPINLIKNQQQTNINPTQVIAPAPQPVKQEPLQNMSNTPARPNNPLMHKFNASTVQNHQQVQDSSIRNESPTKKNDNRLSEMINSDPSKKRNTAKVELLQQISEAWQKKLVENPTESSEKSPSRSGTIDLTPLEAHDTNITPDIKPFNEPEVERKSRKDQLIENSDTTKRCRACQKPCKLTNMYYHDTNFFCGRCYEDLSRRLKQKGLNNCGGCTKESSKVIVIKFLLGNNYVKNKGSLVFTRDKRMDEFYTYSKQYAAMPLKSPELQKLLLLAHNNLMVPVSTFAEIKVCNSCYPSFVICAVCRILVHKNETFNNKNCKHRYCLDCLTLIYLKKFPVKKEFTCKGSFCWTKTPLTQVQVFLIEKLEQLSSDFNSKGGNYLKNSYLPVT